MNEADELVLFCNFASRACKQFILSVLSYGEIRIRFRGETKAS